VKNTRKRGVRPTSSLVLNAVANIVGSFEDVIFIDLFAGTGRVGLEAEKRGARVIYVEKNPRLADQIKERVEGKVIRADALSFLRNFPGKADVIFADPPYSFKHYEKLISLSLDKIARGGIFILEHSKMKSFPCDDRREYGDTALSLWRR